MANEAITLDAYRARQAARPTRTKQRKPSGNDVYMSNKLKQVIESSAPVKLSMTYMKGTNRGRPMLAEHIRGTFNRKHGDEMKEYGLVVDVFSWDADGNYIEDEALWEAFLAPIG